ncbi:MAG: peptidylprolyl isomerase [Oscillospiraceae bacterium]|nr:peptidylprolyl isomerase [Oscillospiraceae bacterium]
MKKIFIVILTLSAVLITASGCFMFDQPYNPLLEYDFGEMRLIQLEPPAEGQPIVTVHTTEGTFTAMLFPEYAPKTVENFIERVNDGFYDEKPVFAISDGEFFLTGALNDEGTQGVTMDGRLIPNEYSVDLWPFKGSLMSFSGRPGYGDSRFFALGSKPFTDELSEELDAAVKQDGTRLFPKELIEAFSQNENLAEAMCGYTIFGQVIDGFDVLDIILSAETDSRTFRPLEDIIIEKIELSEYKGE